MSQYPVTCPIQGRRQRSQGNRGNTGNASNRGIHGNCRERGNHGNRGEPVDQSGAAQRGRFGTGESWKRRFGPQCGFIDGFIDGFIESGESGGGRPSRVRGARAVIFALVGQTAVLCVVVVFFVVVAGQAGGRAGLPGPLGGQQRGDCSLQCRGLRPGIRPGLRPGIQRLGVREAALARRGEARHARRGAAFPRADLFARLALFAFFLLGDGLGGDAALDDAALGDPSNAGEDGEPVAAAERAVQRGAAGDPVLSGQCPARRLGRAAATIGRHGGQTQRGRTTLRADGAAHADRGQAGAVDECGRGEPKGSGGNKTVVGGDSEKIGVLIFVCDNWWFV